MAKPTAMDEYFVHQIPQLLPQVVNRHEYWRESYFFELHDPEVGPDSDVVFFTFAHYPSREVMDSLQMGRVGGEAILGSLNRPYDGDPHTTTVPGASIDVVRPLEEIRLWADPDVAAIGLDLTFTARTQAYGLRRGTMRAGDELIWDQSHIFQSGVYEGTYTANGVTREVDGWVGQRDHSWGIRNHGRCPLWIWFQIQLEDGFLGVWHWEYENGATVYTDGCWAPVDGSDPIPIVGFDHGVDWTTTTGDKADYGQHGDLVHGLAGTCAFELANGQRIEVEAEGTFARPYEPFHRGGLNLMTVRTDDGREGTAIYEVTGARHRHFFPTTTVDGALPS